MVTHQNPDKEKAVINVENEKALTGAPLDKKIEEDISETNALVGEVLDYENPGNALEELKQDYLDLVKNQKNTMEFFEGGKNLTKTPDHFGMSDEINKYQINHLKFLLGMEKKIQRAKGKTKLNEIRTEGLPDEKAISEFNRKRLVEYSKAGAKSVGNVIKYVGIETGKLAFWAAKTTVKTAAEIWYSLWGAHRDYRAKYPKEIEF